MTKAEKKVLYIKEKLLIVIYEEILKQQKASKYEDIYVKAFKKYPNDFQLRGYPQYLDTELMSKKIYDLRKNGFVQVHRKFITLTEKGKIFADRLVHADYSHKMQSTNAIVLSRDIKIEIDRIKKTDAYLLFVSNKEEQIVDSDFFNYLGATVKTERTDFNARIKTVKYIIDAINAVEEYKDIVNLHHYLFEKFNELIKTKLSIGYPRRKR